MKLNEIRSLYQSVVEDILELCIVDETILDKEMFKIYIATVWGNSVLEPERMGIAENDLAVLHDYLNEELAKAAGKEVNITSCFEFIMTKQGEESLSRYRVTKQHKEFLHYFARLILPPQIQR
jgi:hypothetical protein|tara:strand:- start:3812 stop:4180 length:369 start_codon:yes stop_codon:yes gene_type:complete